MVVNNTVVDDTDKLILELLQEDAKITIREISEKTDKSATAIRGRIQRLEKVLIKKYVALIDCRHLGYREMVMVSLRINATKPLELVKKEIESSLDIPQIVAEAIEQCRQNRRFSPSVCALFRRSALYQINSSPCQ